MKLIILSMLTSLSTITFIQSSAVALEVGGAENVSFANSAATECYCLGSRSDHSNILDTICLNRQGSVDLYWKNQLAFNFNVKVQFIPAHRSCAHGKDGPICGTTPDAYGYDNTPPAGAPWPQAVLLGAIVPVEKDPPGIHRGYMSEFFFDGPETYRFWPSDNKIMTPKFCAEQ